MHERDICSNGPLTRIDYFLERGDQFFKYLDTIASKTSKHSSINLFNESINSLAIGADAFEVTVQLYYLRG